MGIDNTESVPRAEYDELLRKLKAAEIEKNKLLRELRTQAKQSAIKQMHIETQAGLNKIILEEKEKQELYVRLLLESYPDIMFIFDKNMKFLLGSQSIVNAIGVDDISLLLGRDLDTIMTRYRNTVFAEEMTDLIREMILSQGNCEPVKEFVVSFGTNKYEVSILPILKKDEFYGALVLMDDITEQKAAEEALKQREDTTNMLNKMANEFLLHDDKTLEDKMSAGVKFIAERMDLDNITVWRHFQKPDGLYTSQIYRWNREAGGTAPPRPELQNEPLSMLTPEWEEILLNKKVLNGPVRLMDNPPAMFKRFGVVSAFLAPLFFNNEHWGFVIFEDQKNERYFDDVEVMRSAAFLCANTVLRKEMEDELKAALQNANEANKAKGDFLSRMSHEMRTPMNAIIGMTNIAKDSKDPDKKEYCLGKIENASNHLLGVINDILDISKIEVGKLTLSPVEFNFERMLQRVADIIDFRVEGKNQAFTVYIDQDIPQNLIGDDQRLAQVVANILGNAVKFTPDNGSINLDVRLKETKNDISTIQVTVTDNGIGISQEQQAGLFQSFQQAEGSTARKYGGTGLGLAISKNIIEMMGGEIMIESELGKGSSFIFTVQMKNGSERNTDLQFNINWDEIRILVVDDDPNTLLYIREIMHRFGASCDTAKNADEAFDLIEKSGGYHVCFIDWNMPDMDGIQLTNILKTKTSNFGSIIIMISSTDWSLIEKDAKKAGVDKFLQKPIFPSVLVDTLTETIGVKQLNAEDDLGKIPGQFAGKHILLAEDVEINREIVMALLEPMLLTIDCAANGAEAVDMFKRAPETYDMIFMDIQMPEVDGYEATQQIRALAKVSDPAENIPKANTIPIVAMTANVFREDIERCLDAGMNDHIGKPLDFNEVIAVLEKYLN